MDYDRPADNLMGSVVVEVRAQSFGFPLLMYTDKYLMVDQEKSSVFRVQ